VAHEVNVFPKARNVGFVEAIQLAISYPTSAAALTWPAVLDLQKGQTLLVHAAAGGVGMAAVEIGKILGATVIATAGSERKTAFARAHGADHVIDYRATDFRDEVLKLTDGRGVDRVYDPVGGDVFTQSLRCMAVESRICPIGFASGTIPQIPANVLLVKTIAVTGFNYGYYVGWSPHDARFEEADRVLALMDRIRAWCEAGRCHPHVDRTFPLDQAADAMRALLERSVTGRVAVVME
jgi:NADPH2:quinone reductase